MNGILFKITGGNVIIQLLFVIFVILERCEEETVVKIMIMKTN